ncbi:MAG TPA: hypothetical protein VLL47_08540 [Robiginitalea sp.]|nr:hypothetical protein [Robiginitalea sp.]
MSTYREKLSILSEMIAFARADQAIKDSEFFFLLGVSELLGVDRQDFEDLLEAEAEHVLPESEAERILQFHRLVLLMNIDRNRHPEEIRRLHNIGLAMGLSLNAIDQVLVVMHQYPDKIVPPDVLIGIFKAHYN